jgi:hypothetical protein
MSVFNRNLFEAGFDLVPDLLNQDANADLTGDWICLRHYYRAYLMLIKPAGSGGDDLSIHLQQALSAAGGSAKDLIFSKLWYKKATATNDFTAVGQWTAVELATPVADLDLASVNGVDLATDTVGAVILVEVLAESLDLTNGFDFVNVIYEGDDIGNALVINSHWLLMGGKFAQAIPLSPLA